MKLLLEEYSDPCSHAAVFTDAVRQGIGGRTGEQISSHMEQLPSCAARDLQQMRKTTNYSSLLTNELIQSLLFTATLKTCYYSHFEDHF